MFPVVTSNILKLKGSDGRSRRHQVLLFCVCLLLVLVAVRLWGTDFTCQQEARLEADRITSIAEIEQLRISSATKDTEIEALKQQAADRLQRGSAVAARDAEIADLKQKLRELEHVISAAKHHVENVLAPQNLCEDPEGAARAQKMVEECRSRAEKNVASEGVEIWKGYRCRASDAEMSSYLAYEPRGLCPDDWMFVQKLIFEYDCFALPKRMCRNRTPHAITEPLPFPSSLFAPSSLQPDSVRWAHHACDSFTCLQNRLVGDCRPCFNLSGEYRRWRHPKYDFVTVEKVVAMKGGGLRLGLDVGGGTGSFAAHMALHNCTILTTAVNLETVGGGGLGVPYMETIALRGLVPLHLPHKARLPFFDNTLDMVHSSNTIKYVPLLEFEELLFEWDRVLRPGGVLWFELFYAPAQVLPLYITVIEGVGYNKLLWNITRKSDLAEQSGPHLYLNCLLEKPERLE